ncbi:MULTISPECIES: bifunctional 4-hydroxy-2-oxoglutarate aldolase/2-dehydro-3-deoxy-phosphogluconate aldolase [Pseudoalteromonas]|uniref:2-dehydro-3-deoxyphosphogluconate aldolase / (4S)-4-hydroxy-2-oxoglutarate aldolase n=1 Tax=Pseudoalteromonas lipolytica TaxID=570156 RepID=A0ABY1GG48_9GAMM|nr:MULTISPECIES: bifunctional 4-hydroxy-2-oxoglutarate aldolase/2-dehydro-3-deoxy-phosphogluconate aldolase [Pseudoalteromonas]MBE0352920.1 2-dehydro-3-deoxyphosphogluconate aldolase / (4S)-4-hydroxy-2-oxoglutarate aldolase [Pseudoalteromonas lipolytica LMEB 39]QLJ10048.1 bifunctional 4-hydroxy-2-oxoglutarate aldolase/2-dehydro-3-deoxy-phosphogluconate aldolase [Pseudoalteromonas sp. JSTW]SFT52457.1 2-dehydro-3-deoxyphosphogluconate aldolase / (4S)-4-hydroxy-2-oxoglutarate aldolase [Pseudoaltero|tara:strand:+ start:9232 stop:9858 length:627 start_codon:yes stop_codon:yes gene_type:complete
MAQSAFSKLMAGQPILPIIQAHDPQQGVAVARAMQDAGINLVEVVLRTEQSLAAITAIKSALPNLIVGAGTITRSDTLNNAINAGADYIVTPAVSPRLLDALASCGKPCLPGVSNNADILLASEYGFTEHKLFPASLCGGIDFLHAVSSVFQEVRFCPTGGVNAQNFKDFLALDNVFAVGGTWVAKPDWVNTKDWQSITQACANVLTK